jgi:CheY-like chemotaxis protein
VHGSIFAYMPVSIIYNLIAHLFTQNNTMQKKPERPYLLLVDDDPDEVFIISRIFSGLDSPNNLFHVNSGEKAIEYLDQAYLKVNLPDAILLDINMPRMNGTQTLAAIRKNRSFSHIKVYMYSTGINPTVIETCKQLGVAGFIHKDPNNEGVRKLIEELVVNA